MTSNGDTPTSPPAVPYCVPSIVPVADVSLDLALPILSEESSDLLTTAYKPRYNLIHDPRYTTEVYNVLNANDAKLAQSLASLIQKTNANYVYVLCVYSNYILLEHLIPTLCR